MRQSLADFYGASFPYESRNDHVTREGGMLLFQAHHDIKTKDGSGMSQPKREGFPVPEPILVVGGPRPRWPPRTHKTDPFRNGRRGPYVAGGRAGGV